MNEQTNQQTDFANQWITKQAAIDALGEKPLVWDDLSDFDLGKAAQWSDDVDAIKALPSAQTTQNNTPNALKPLDCVDRQEAIDALDVLCQEHRYKIPGKVETYSQYNEAWQDALDRAEGAIGNLPSAQPKQEQPTNIQDILEYLDTVLHPIVSPEHWNIYSELYDMISALPSAQPQRMKGKWIDVTKTGGAELWKCSECGELELEDSYFCPNCGSNNRGEEDETD